MDDPTRLITDPIHRVLGSSMLPPFPAGSERIVLGSGCFWGDEKEYWQLPGVITTAVGFAGGHTPQPTYELVCDGGTGHAEVVQIIFDPAVIGLEQILTVFWESHDPTQGNRQGNDIGAQYRSIVLYTSEVQRQAAERSRAQYGQLLAKRGFGPITTTIEPLQQFWYAEQYHQQYLDSHPFGYCPIHATGVRFATAE